MTEILAGIMVLAGLTGLTIWALHAGGFRRSPVLRRLEDRYPNAALFFGLVSPEKRQELLPESKLPLVERALNLFVRGISLLGALFFLIVTVYLLASWLIR